MKFDELASQFFDNPKDFGKAMELLLKSTKAWEDYPEYLDYEEHFLSHLEEDTIDEFLFLKAVKFGNQVQKEIENLQKENLTLKSLIEAGKIGGDDLDKNEIARIIKSTLDPPLSEEDNPTLREVYNEWHKEKQNSMRTASLNDAYAAPINLFIEYLDSLSVNEIRVNDLGISEVRNFKKFLGNLPLRIITKNHSIKELISLSNGCAEKMSLKTQKSKLANIGTFIKWVSSQGYPIKDRVHEVLTNFEKIDPRKVKKRVPLSDEDIEKLFMSNRYLSNGKFKTSAMYWVPLIAIYSGARMSEILQLENHDISLDKDTNIWTININDIDPKSSDPDKHVKKDGSRRQLPVHKALIKLGFIDYVKTRNSRLFPDEDRSKNGKFDKFQKRFTTYRKQVGVKPQHALELRDFHSIRHTVRTKLSELRTTGKPTEKFGEGIIDEIVGHASKDRSIGQKKYNHAQRLKPKYLALNRLQYVLLHHRCIYTQPCRCASGHKKLSYYLHLT